jgi:hypothetical protein
MNYNVPSAVDRWMEKTGAGGWLDRLVSRAARGVGGWGEGAAARVDQRLLQNAEKQWNKAEQSRAQYAAKQLALENDPQMRAALARREGRPQPQPPQTTTYHSVPPGGSPSAPASGSRSVATTKPRLPASDYEMANWQRLGLKDPGAAANVAIGPARGTTGKGFIQGTAMPWMRQHPLASIGLGLGGGAIAGGMLGGGGGGIEFNG